MEYLVTVLAGTSVGVFAGLLSGIGPFASMLIFYPFLIELSIEQILLFYVSLITATQYIGSVAAIYLGIPGETTSMPAVIEGRRLYKKHLSHYAITNTAIGSFVGGIVAVAFTLTILPGIMTMFEFTFRNDFRLILFVVVLTTIVITSNRNLLVSILLLVLGSVLGMVGVDPWSGDPRMTMGILDLEFGIPEVSVLFAVFVLPILLKSTTGKINMPDQDKLHQASILSALAVYLKSARAGLRGSVLGYFLGLVPSVGIILASNFSYSTEKKISSSALHRITSAEAANNSGVFTMLLPLLIIGIPIAGSEVVVYELLSQKGMQFGINHDPEALVYSIVPWVILVNFIMLLLSWPLSRYLIQVYKIPVGIIRTVCLLLIAYTVLYIGYNQGTIELHVLSFLCLLPVGYLFRNYNTLPFVLGFLLAEQMEGIVLRQLALFGLTVF